MKKNILSISLGVFIGIASTSSMAQLAEIDPPKWGAILIERLQGMERFNTMMNLKDQYVESLKEVAGAKIDAFNNGSSNYVLRTSDVSSDLFNLKTIMSSLPTLAACEQMSVSLNMDNILCNARKQTHYLNESMSSLDTPISSLENNDNVIAKQYGFGDRDGDGDIDETDAGYDIATRNIGNEVHLYTAIQSLVSNGANYLTLDPSQYQAAKDSILLMTPRYKVTASKSDLSPGEVSKRLSVDQESAIKSLVFTTFNNILAQKSSVNPDEFSPSPFHAMKAEAATFYSYDDHEDTIAYKASVSPIISPTQMYRYILLSNAMSVNQQTLSYEMGIRSEAIEATKLKLLIENKL